MCRIKGNSITFTKNKQRYSILNTCTLPYTLQDSLYSKGIGLGVKCQISHILYYTDKCYLEGNQIKTFLVVLVFQRCSSTGA